MVRTSQHPLWCAGRCFRTLIRAGKGESDLSVFTTVRIDVVRAQRDHAYWAESSGKSSACFFSFPTLPQPRAAAAGGKFVNFQSLESVHGATLHKMSMFLLKLRIFFHPKILIPVVALGFFCWRVVDGLVEEIARQIEFPDGWNHAEVAIRGLILRRGARAVWLWTLLPASVGWMMATKAIKKIECFPRYR